MGATVSECTHSPAPVAGSDSVAYQTSKRFGVPCQRGLVADASSLSTDSLPPIAVRLYRLNYYIG